MVRLVIPLPRERVQEIRSCIALFSCDNELVLSPLVLPGSEGDFFIRDGRAHIVLWQRLTQCWVLRVQLECFGDTEGLQFISRTAISEPITFGQSLADSTDLLPECETQPNALTQLLADMHRHINLSVLDEIGPPLTNCEINDLINIALKGVKL